MHGSHKVGSQHSLSLPKRWFTRLGGYTLFAAIAVCAVALAYPGPSTVVAAVLILAVHVFYFDLNYKLNGGSRATVYERRWIRLGRLADTLAALAIGTFIAIPGWVSGAGALAGMVLIAARMQLGRTHQQRQTD